MDMIERDGVATCFVLRIAWVAYQPKQNMGCGISAKTETADGRGGGDKKYMLPRAFAEEGRVWEKKKIKKMKNTSQKRRETTQNRTKQKKGDFFFFSQSIKNGGGVVEGGLSRGGPLGTSNSAQKGIHTQNCGQLFFTTSFYFFLKQSECLRRSREGGQDIRRFCSPAVDFDTKRGCKKKKEDRAPYKNVEGKKKPPLAPPSPPPSLQEVPPKWDEFWGYESKIKKKKKKKVVSILLHTKRKEGWFSSHRITHTLISFLPP